jgi:bleomycin hydrolase
MRKVLWVAAALLLPSIPVSTLAAPPSKALRKYCELALSSKDIPIEWVAAAQAAHERQQSPAEAQFQQTVGLVGVGSASLNTTLARAYDASPPQYNVSLNRFTETDQGGSGRCWAFAGLNVLRRFPVAAGLLPDNFEYSQTYVYWWHIFEQANDYLELLIRARSIQKGPEYARDLMNPAAHISQGGWYERFAYLVDKYGLVPKEAMPDHSDIVSRHQLVMDFLTERLAVFAIEMQDKINELKTQSANTDLTLRELRKIKIEAMEEVRRVLTISLGAPPSKFEWTFNGPMGRLKDQPDVDLRIFTDTMKFKGTPKDFYKKFVTDMGLDPLNDFAVVSASPFLATGQVYTVRKDKFASHASGATDYEQKTLNLTIDDLILLTQASIEAGMPVWFAADVSRDVEPGIRVMDPNLFNREAVYQVPQVDWPNEDTRRRALTYTRVVNPNHAMVIEGERVTKKNGPVDMWRVENSWGTYYPDDRPHPWHMTGRWYRENVYQIVVHKDVMGPELWKVWTDSQSVPIKKEAWMFGPQPK